MNVTRALSSPSLGHLRLFSHRLSCAIRLALWLGDELFGKAPMQPTDDNGEPVAVAGFYFLKHKRYGDTPANT